MISIDPDLLRKLYLEDGLTILQISEKLGVSCCSTVQKRLVSLGIKKVPKNKLDPEYLRTLLSDPTLTRQQIANKLGVSLSWVHIMRQQLGIRVKTKKVDRDQLIYLYQELQFNAAQVGQILGLSRPTVCRKLRAIGITPRNASYFYKGKEE